MDRGAELLAELQGVCGADLDTLGAGHTFCFVHFCLEVRADRIARAEHQADAKAETGAGAAVADSGAFAGLLDVGDVVHQAVFLSAQDDLQGFFPADLAGTSGTDVVLGAFAHLYAHFLRQMSAAVVNGRAGRAAGAGRYAEAVVLVQVIAESLIVADIGDVLDRAFHRKNTHQAVAVRDHRRHGLHANAGILLKRAADFRVGIQQLLIVDQHLHDAGCKDLHEVDVFPELLVIGAAEHADPCEVLRKLLNFLHGLSDFFCQIAGCSVFPQAGGDSDIRLVVGDNACQRIVLRRVLIDLVHNAGQSADDVTQFYDFWSQLCHNFPLKRCFLFSFFTFFRLSETIIMEYHGIIN